jgi:hypothetical protein
MYVDWHRSQVLADQIGAEPKACWHNACVALLVLQDPALTYVEGFAGLSYGLVIEHGWLEKSPDCIIDPTLVLQSGEQENPARYFAGVRYTYEQVYRLCIKQHKAPPFVWASGWGGTKSQEYMQAQDWAYREIYGISLKDLLT